MSSTKSKKSKKVPTNRGPLTPNTNFAKEDFPDLANTSGKVESLSRLFEGQARSARSPAHGITAGTGTETTTPVSVTPSQAVTPAPVMSPYHAVIALARQEEEELLEACLKTLKVMKAAAEIQKNMAKDVKTGILTLESNLQRIAHLRKSWKSCEVVSCTTQTTPSLCTRLQPSGSKGAAPSPEEPEADERQKDDSPEESDSRPWSQALGRKAKKKQLPQQQALTQPGDKERRKPQKKPVKNRPPAILVRPSEGKSYADVLGEIRRKVKPEDQGAVIKGLRKTRSGDLLVELGEGTGSRSDFGADLRTTLGGIATVRELEPRSTLEVRDLDEITTVDEVSGVVKSLLGDTAEVKTFVSKANSRGQRMAILTLGARDAAKLLDKGHLKIGWVSCRVREKPVVPRCFRCLGFGHLANRCGGPDRSKLCFKCGGQGHRASACNAALSCVLCTDAGLKNGQVKHATGSSRCGEYKQALQKLRSKSKK